MTKVSFNLCLYSLCTVHNVMCHALICNIDVSNAINNNQNVGRCSM